MPKVAQDPEAFLPLTPAVFHILLVLADEDRHGYGIMQEVKKRTNHAIQLGPGTLYSSIKKLLDSGWIVEIEPEDAPADEDERRKYYHLTDFGDRVLRAEARRLAHVVNVARNMGLLGGWS